MENLALAFALTILRFFIKNHAPADGFYRFPSSAAG
jgi:hypothetical protein